MIFYKKKKKYKYKLEKSYQIEIDIEIEKEADLEYIVMSRNRTLLIRKGYAWDGATSAPDTKNIMRGSLVHDVLYQLIREGYISENQRERADQILIEICLENGMWKFYAKLVYVAVRLFGYHAIEPDTLKAP